MSVRTAARSIPDAKAERGQERGGIITFLMLAVVVVVAGAAAFWWFFVRSDAAPPPTIENTSVVAGGTLDGSWTATPGGPSFVQYRVKEQFAGAVIQTDATGRTNDVTGTMTINGTTVSGSTVSANLVTLKSDKDRRDHYIRDNGLQSNQFPTASVRADATDHLGPSTAKGREDHDRRHR